MAEIATLGLQVDASGVVRGVGIATRELDRLGGRSDQAKLNVKGLQGALGSLATAALNLPGPLGRVGQILGSFALGGGMMLAVTAGVAAVGAAWQALSRDAEEARRSSKAMADQLMSDSRRLSDFSRQALLVRQQTLEARRDELAQAIANQGKPTSAHPDLSTAAGRMAFGAATSAQRATFFFPTVSPQEAEKLYEYDRALREVTKAIQALDDAAKPKGSAGGGSRGGGRVVELGPGPIDVETVRAYAKALADAAEQKRRLVSGVVGPIPGFQMDPNLPLTTIKRIADKAERDKLNQQLAQGSFLGIAGGFASQAGPLGGAFSGGIGALAAGAGPMGIAASAAQGLIGSLMSLADSGNRARESMRQLHLGVQNFIAAAEVELGLMTRGQYAERQTRQQIAEQQRSLSGMSNFDPNNPLHRELILQRYGEEEGQRRLAEIERLRDLEERLVGHRSAEADQIERINSAVRNAPRGFFVESYLRRLGVPSGGTDTVTGPIGTMPTDPSLRPRGPSGGTNIVVNVNGATDPLTTTRAVVQALDQWASATFGAGTSRADALNFLPVS